MEISKEIKVSSTTPTEVQSGESSPSTQHEKEGHRGTFKGRRHRRYKKFCFLCRQGRLLIDYKEIDLLKNYLRRYNKILIHKSSGNCLKHQHQLAKAIKRARFISLLPFVPE